MGLAREQDLDRPLGIVQDAREPFGIGKEQQGSFVGGESPCESDGQHLGVQHVVGLADLLRRAAVAGKLLSQARARRGYQSFAPTLVGAP